MKSFLLLLCHQTISLAKDKKNPGQMQQALRKQSDIFSFSQTEHEEKAF